MFFSVVIREVKFCAKKADEKSAVLNTIFSWENPTLHSKCGKITFFHRFWITLQKEFLGINKSLIEYFTDILLMRENCWLRVT